MARPVAPTRRRIRTAGEVPNACYREHLPAPRLGCCRRGRRLRHARLLIDRRSPSRAVHRAIARAANSGPSRSVAPDGGVAGLTGVGSHCAHGSPSTSSIRFEPASAPPCARVTPGRRSPDACWVRCTSGPWSHSLPTTWSAGRARGQAGHHLSGHSVQARHPGTAAVRDYPTTKPPCALCRAIAVAAWHANGPLVPPLSSKAGCAPTTSR